MVLPDLGVTGIEGAFFRWHVLRLEHAPGMADIAVTWLMGVRVTMTCEHLINGCVAHC